MDSTVTENNQKHTTHTELSFELQQTSDVPWDMGFDSLLQIEVADELKKFLRDYATCIPREIPLLSDMRLEPVMRLPEDHAIADALYAVELPPRRFALRVTGRGQMAEVHASDEAVRDTEIQEAFKPMRLLLGWSIRIDLPTGLVTARASVLPFVSRQGSRIHIRPHATMLEELFGFVGIQIHRRTATLGYLSEPVWRYIPDDAPQDIPIVNQYGFMSNVLRWRRGMSSAFFIDHQRHSSHPPQLEPREVSRGT